MAGNGNDSPKLARQSVEVAYPVDVGRARRAARSLAADLGFAERAAEEIALVASELASNLVKHGGGGTVELLPLADPTGIEIVSLDSGPGIPNLSQAMSDGFSTSGSLGYGLGTVNRLMDDLEITTPPGGMGLQLVCRRWIPPDHSAANRSPMAIGVATRPRPGMTVNGDSFVVKRWGENLLVGLIDGLGHGEAAHAAAEAARHYVESHFAQPLDALFRGAGLACASTRGVVMALARFDSAASETSSTLRFASVGNVEARVFGALQSMSFMVRRGVLGHNAPAPIVTNHPWRPEYSMVLHTDGVRSRWTLSDFPDLAGQPPETIAQGLLYALAKDEDDATVLVVRKSLR